MSLMRYFFYDFWYVNTSEKRLQDSLITEELLIMMNLIITKN